MKLSIIIPVYRVEATLNRCIESVVTQDDADFELILVDDGSPDKCPQMCDDWAARDQRIKVIHKTNGGLSDARNAGIEIAQGDYLTFIDSDDYIAEHTFAPLMQTLADRPDIDILEYPIFVFYGSPKQHRLAFQEERVYDDMDDYWYKGQAYLHSYACNKIYRAGLFQDVRYPVGILFEDMHTLPRLLKKAKTVMTTGQGLYYYCMNDSSITATANGNALRMLLQPHAEIIKNSQSQDRDFQTYYLHVLNIQMDVYELTGDCPILPRLHLKPDYFKGVHKLKAIALNILGINYICKTPKFIHKLWKSR
jgi:glycosyltransferase involved in cell wall biosynthesis